MRISYQDLTYSFSSNNFIKYDYSNLNEQCIKERCLNIGKKFDDNWGLDDPTGKSDDDFKSVIQKIIELKKNLLLKRKDNVDN